MQDDITNVLMKREHSRGHLAIAATSKAVDYVQWFMEQANTGASPDDIMPLVMQHTQTWGLAQGIMAALAVHNDEIDTMYTKIPNRKKTKDSDAKVQLLKIVFFAELLHEIFVANTNFTDKYKDIN